MVGGCDLNTFCECAKFSKSEFEKYYLKEKQNKKQTQNLFLGQTVGVHTKL